MDGGIIITWGRNTHYETGSSRIILYLQPHTKCYSLSGAAAAYIGHCVLY